jgi:hypothetical protein
MMKKNNYKEALNILKDLHEEYPSYSLGRHIHTALADYGNFWGITDKELCFALNKYKAELEMDNDQIVSDNYVYEIQKDAENLFSNTEKWED